jgi:transcription initiation factor IIE alpha subunit
MPYEFICPRCGGRSYSAAANGSQPCPHCGEPLDASNASNEAAERPGAGEGSGESG